MSKCLNVEISRIYGVSGLKGYGVKRLTVKNTSWAMNQLTGGRKKLPYLCKDTQ